jgi:beta-lactamase class A
VPLCKTTERLATGQQAGGPPPAGRLPADWRVGDKTGSGSNGTANDVAIAFPPGRSPILIAAYYTEATIPDDARNTVIAEAGRLAVAGLS